MLEQELMPAAGHPSRFSLDGKDLVLDLGCAYGLSLIFHELAANAARHGSLSRQEGHVDVCWRVESGDLVLAWTERGGPPVRRPISPGFGSFLVTYAAVKLKGSANLLYLPSGLRCELRVSLLAQWPRRRGAMALEAHSASIRPT
jgi:two-component sensor histidine kinase